MLAEMTNALRHSVGKPHMHGREPLKKLALRVAPQAHSLIIGGFERRLRGSRQDRPNFPLCL